MSQLSVALLFAILAAGCGAAGENGSRGQRGSVEIDSWPIGAERICALSDARCAALLPAAIRGFDLHDPDHAAIVRASLHDEGPVFDPAGNRILMTRSGSCCSVAVFELADGSVRAIGVGYPGVSQTPVAVEQGP